MPDKTKSKKRNTKVKPKNVWKVAELKAKNPHITVREIRSKTWLAHETIQKATEELKHNWSKDEAIRYIVDESRKRIERAQKIFNRYLDEVEEKSKLDRWDISLTKDIVKDDLTRVTIFWWSVTDDEGGLKDLSSATTREIEERIKKALWS